MNLKEKVPLNGTTTLKKYTNIESYFLLIHCYGEPFWEANSPIIKVYICFSFPFTVHGLTLVDTVVIRPVRSGKWRLSTK